MSQDGVSPPYSGRVEISVLGAPLAAPAGEQAKVLAQVVEAVAVEDFFLERNQRIFRALRALYNRGKAVDPALLADELRATGDFEAAGGMPYLSRLIDAVPSGRRVADHAARLRELHVLRDVQVIAGEIHDSTSEIGPGETSDMLSSLRKRLLEYQDRMAAGDDGGLRTARDILEDPEARTSPAPVAGRLAWEELVTLLAGREKTGKSTLLRFAVARVTNGRRIWTHEPTAAGPRDVVYWAEERPEDVARDLNRMGADLDRVYVRDMRLVARDRFSALRHDLDRTVPALLIIDTLATLTDRMDLDPGSSSDWSKVMNRVGALAQESEVAVVLTHHARKSDGEYRDSTAIGGGVDCLLQMRRDDQESKAVRKVSALSRSSIDARDFKYELVESGERPSLDLLDGSLSLKERIQRFVQQNPGCSQNEVRNDVQGRDTKILGALSSLSEDGGPIVCEDDSTPYQYWPRENPEGVGPEQARNNLGTRATGNGGGSCSKEGERPEGSPPPEQQAEPVRGDK